MIRLATEADWATVPEIHRAAFGDHGDDVAWLVGELRASEWYEPELSFVAEDEGRIVGHVMNTWCWLEGGSPRIDGYEIRATRDTPGGATTTTAKR